MNGLNRRHSGRSYSSSQWTVLPVVTVDGRTRRHSERSYPSSQWTVLPVVTVDGLTRRHSGRSYPSSQWTVLPVVTVDGLTAARPSLSCTRAPRVEVVVFARDTRPTHDHRHVRVVDDVGTDAADDRPPEFAESARADYDHVGVAFLRQLHDSFAGLTVADDVTAGDLKIKVKVKVTSYIVQYPNHQDCSKRCTRYSLAELFNRTPSRLLWETSSHAAINARRVSGHKYPLLSIASYSFIHLSEIQQYNVNKLVQGLTKDSIASQALISLV